MPDPTPGELLRAVAESAPLEPVARRLGLAPEHVRRLLLDLAARPWPAPRGESKKAPVSEELPWQRRLDEAPAAPATEMDAPAAPREKQPAAAAKTFEHLVLFTDGAARGNPGPAGAGAVLCTPDGKVVERLGRYLGVQTNNVAEYEGLLLGMRRALELGARRLDVRADSLLVISQMRGEWKIKHPGLRPLFDEAKQLERRFERIGFGHVRREQNVEADEMSNRAIDERM